GTAGARGATGATGAAGPQGPAGKDAPAPTTPLPTYAGARYVFGFSNSAFTVAQVAGCSRPRFDQLPLDCQITMKGLPTGELLTWIQAAMSGSAAQIKDADILQLDFSLKPLVRVDLKQAFIKRVAVTPVDGGATNALQTTITLVSDDVTRRVATTADTPTMTDPKVSNTQLASNFSASIDGVPDPRAISVDGIGFTRAVVPATATAPRTPGALTPDVMNVVAGSLDDALRPWSDAAAAGGGARTFTVTFFGPDMKAVLGAWTVTQTKPLGEVSPFTEGATPDASGRLRVAVQGTGVALTTGPA
ncbi:MAG: hypothetical protein AAGC46_07390, partial [Solirubrobacteraceae bacterium]|nr:hypothetical protein [Patulibacter sp.]